MSSMIKLIKGHETLAAFSIAISRLHAYHVDQV